MNVKTPVPVPFSEYVCTIFAVPVARGWLTEMRSLATFAFCSGLRNALFPAKNLLFNANACQMCSNGRVPLRELSCGEHPEKKAKFEKMPSANLMNTSKIVLKFTKVVPDAFAPTKGSEKAAGFDLKSAYDYTVPARGKEMIDTGIKIQLPEGCYGRIAPRSGLAAKHFIDVGAGVVDEDYRGVIKVILFNHSNADFKVNRGDRIAQLICERIYYPEIVETQELNGTDRGEGGFGSTGTN